MNCTGKNCPMQYGKVDPATCESVKYCPEATPPKTNADRIRSMTDEELAEFFDNTCIENLGKVRCDSYGRCYDCMLDWLKEEAKE